MLAPFPHQLRLLFFFNDTATTEIYTLSLHDALPISRFADHELLKRVHPEDLPALAASVQASVDRKSTRLNSSHANISYAVFCLKKKTPPVAQSQPVIRDELHTGARHHFSHLALQSAS